MGKAYGTQSELMRELRDAVTVTAYREACQGKVLKEHGEWLAWQEAQRRRTHERTRRSHWEPGQGGRRLNKDRGARTLRAASALCRRLAPFGKDWWRESLDTARQERAPLSDSQAKVQPLGWELNRGHENRKANSLNQTTHEFTHWAQRTTTATSEPESASHR